MCRAVETQIRMRVVVDTNVLVSGVLNPHGPPGRIVDAILAETLTALYDDRMRPIARS